MSEESTVQNLEDLSQMRERVETKLVWVWVPVFDDWVDGLIPAYLEERQ